MSRKIRFEDDDKDSRQSDIPAEADTASKQRKRRGLRHEESTADAKPELGAAPDQTTGAAFTPNSNNAISDTGNVVAGGLNSAGIGHGAASFIRSIAPDETPDRNAAVSATRFALETGATSLDKMAGGQHPKRKSKLMEKDSLLKFDKQEAKSENGDALKRNGDEAEQAESADMVEEPGGEADASPQADDIGNTVPDNDTADPVDSADSSDNAEPLTDAEPKPEQSTLDAEPKPKPSKADAKRKPQPSADDTASVDDTVATDVIATADEASIMDESVTTDDIIDTVIPPNSRTNGKPNGKLKFAKAEKTVAKLEQKADKLGGKLDKAQKKLPSKKVKKKVLAFDEGKGKTVTKLTHEQAAIPIGEAKWNNPTDKMAALKAAGVVTSMTATKVHAKVHQLEHDNVGIKAAHNAELLTESGYHGAKRTANSAYRFHKNRPYRRVAKLEQKSIKNKVKLDYQKVLRDNPSAKSNPLSRFMQKKAIKRNYAKDLRAAKKAAKNTEKAAGYAAKAGKAVTGALRKNPVVIVKVGLLLLLVFLILSLMTMCVGMFSGTSSFVGAVAYPAENEDINDASILYTELETDLQVHVNSIQSLYPGYDEYRISVDTIAHNPLELMGFLSAVYEDFTFAEVEAVIRAIFDEQYSLSIVPEMEIRYRTETRTGSYTDADGNSHSYTYTVEVPYEYHILNVTLTSQPMSSVLARRMDAEQTQHYAALMYSNGARQIVGNPFDFDWLPNVTSLYGYRIHPISGNKEFHWGIDIGVPTGTPIMAGLTGTVVSVGYDAGGYGNYVVIEDADGIQARYAHCHAVFVTQNQPVVLGDVIATVGSTGASTGAHLHMEVSAGGQRINPIFFAETGNEGKSHVSPGHPGGVVIPPYPGEPMDDARFAAIMEEALLHLGKPYVWGASGPDSFDCSGFVWYVLNRSGVASFGRTTAQGIFDLTTPIARENLQPGDLVFLTGTYSTTSPVTHIAIYIGNGMVVHAGNPVNYASIDSAFWLNHYYASGRLH